VDGGIYPLGYLSSDHVGFAVSLIGLFGLLIAKPFHHDPRPIFSFSDVPVAETHFPAIATDPAKKS